MVCSGSGRFKNGCRVVNLSLLNTEWYIEQMKRKRMIRIRFLSRCHGISYKDGTRAFSYFFENENIKGYVDLNQLLDVLKTDPERLIMNNPRYGKLEYFPTRSFKFDVDKSKVLQNGTVAPELADLIVDEINGDQGRRNGKII